MSAESRDDLRRRLSRLGPRAGKPAPRQRERGHASAALPPGELIETPAGKAYRLEMHYPLSHQHGSSRLLDLLAFDDEMELAARVAGSGGLGNAPISSLAFVDTETTGLVGGAGTLVFLVGVGRFQGEEFVLRQYFLRDPGEEAPMLQALEEDLNAANGFVTFNGRSFDVPLLEMRYVIGLRRRLELTGWPNLDLLHPARRLWRRQLPDCSLGTLERKVLGVMRTGQDVPGAEVPGLYLEYLRSGDATDMERVLYHNEVDILSLVGLATEVLGRHQTAEPARLTPSEALGLARWHDSGGRESPAEAAYRAAVETASGGVTAAEALRHYSASLKRQKRYDDATDAWRQWYELDQADPRPCVEMAIHHEWRSGNLKKALAWTERARTCLASAPNDWRRRRQAQAIEHRRQRLQRKLERSE